MPEVFPNESTQGLIINGRHLFEGADRVQRSGNLESSDPIVVTNVYYSGAEVEIFHGFTDNPTPSLLLDAREWSNETFEVTVHEKSKEEPIFNKTVCDGVGALPLPFFMRRAARAAAKAEKIAARLAMARTTE